MSGAPPEGYLIEIRVEGSSAQVSAIDPATGVEVSVIAPANLSRHELSLLAVRKLHYRLKQLATKATDAPQPRKKPGIVI